MRFLLALGLVCGLVSVGLCKPGPCDHKYACEEHGPDNGLIEKIHDVWQVDRCRGHCQDTYDFGCRWFTHWSEPGEHHNECWLFEACEHHKPDCHDHNCISGPAECDMKCDPLPMDNDGTWSCFPEVPDGQSVPDNTHCVFECGNETSSHVCNGGAWDNDPADVECDILFTCPPLGDLDNSHGGVFHCHPHVEPDMEADEGTYCVFECDGHETAETECDFHGNWFPDPADFTCHDAPTTSPPPQTTAAPTITASPTTAPTPTDAPTTAPATTAAPTTAPAPTDAPTAAPATTAAPTTAPAPTDAPTIRPTAAPTDAPTMRPTNAPTIRPTDAPTFRPTDAPTMRPTAAPTNAPNVTDAPSI